MFEKNGVMYAGELAHDLEVDSARFVGNHSLLVTFSTGEVRLFDGTNLPRTSVFSPLQDEGLFRDFSVDQGVLTWADGAIDIAPEGLYERSFEYVG